MAFNQEVRDELRKYLLGQIDEQRLEVIEQRLLTDDEFFEELEISEDELIDEYLARDTTPAERELFEKHFLAFPERQNKLRFAQALARSTPAPQPIPANWLARLITNWNNQAWMFRAATVGALVLVVAALVWLARPQSPKSFATLTLLATTVERNQGAVATKVQLPLQVDALRLQLKLPDGTPASQRYRVQLRTESGETENLTPVEQTGQAVTVQIPSARVSRGQYAFNVTAIKPDGTEERVKGSYLLTVE